MNRTLESPDGRVELTVSLRDSEGTVVEDSGVVHYALGYEGEPLIDPSPLGFEFADSPALATDLEVLDRDRESVDDTWEPTWGRTNRVRNRYEALAVTLRERTEPGRRLTVRFRVYDDGIGFRCELLGEGEAVEITSEDTEFRFADDFTAWWIPGGTREYEELYRETPLSAVENASTPVTMRSREGTYCAVHEAHLVDYADMELSSSGDGSTLASDLVSLPDGTKVACELPHATPWRTVLVGDRPGALIESNLVANLNPPMALEDDSWVEPGTYVGVWWEIHKGTSTWGPGPDLGATTENVERYVDFAAEHDVPYVFAEGWNVGWGEWGGEDGTEDGDRVDFTTPTEQFDLERVLDYCDERGVEFLMHNETFADVDTYEDQIDEAFALYEELGIPGVKTGYVGEIPGGHSQHDQRMVNHHREVVRKAAEHELMINAHEPIKPTGQWRTYPNFMTFEGVRGMEYNAWSEGNSPEHTVTVPFTRMLAGPLDYTPGIFDIEWDPQGDGTRVHTTRARQLSLYPTLFSPLQMLADLPENYDEVPEFEFLEGIPSAWDETRVLNAEIGEYLAIARRSGNEWYVGVGTDEEPRTVAVPLEFLDDGDHVAEVYADGPEADYRTNPEPVEIDRCRVSSADVVEASLAPGGGQAIRIRPSEDEPYPDYRPPEYHFTLNVPASVRPHERLNVGIRVANKGVLPGGREVSVSVRDAAGDVVDRSDLGHVRIGGGDARVFSFSTLLAEPGDYRITAGDEAADVTVN